MCVSGNFCECVCERERERRRERERECDTNGGSLCERGACFKPITGACICVDLMRARERREVLVDVVARSGYYGESY